MAYNVNIQRLDISALVDFKGKVQAVKKFAGAHLPDFPEQPNTLTQMDGRTLAFIGRDHWLLRADIAEENTILAALSIDQAPADVSIVPVSDTMTFFQVTGPDADDIMSIGCPLDLHPRVWGTNAISFSEFFGLRALVQRIEAGFEVGVEQSFGDMVADYLARSKG
jgi:sarcosine oxidase subunit gamma|tara:strand:+ start:21476 stop:21973 length:498 start_codon:yes stop_codon:yes gene_type:complete